MLEALKQIWIPAARPELNFYWYWLQSLVLILPLSHFYSGAAALMLIGIFLWRRGWRELDTSINRGWLGLSGWMIIATLLAFDPSVAWTGLLNFLPFFLLFAIAAFLIQTLEQFRHVLWLAMLSSLPVSLLGIVQAVLNQPTWLLPRLFGSYEITLGMSPDRRVASLFGHFNEAAMYLVLIFPIACHFASAEDRVTSKPFKQTLRQRSWAAIALGLSAITLILLGSRNAWALCGIGIFSLAIYYRYWWFVGGLTALASLLSWAIWGPILGIGGEWLRLLLPGGLVNRLASAIDPARTDFVSTLYRLEAWQFALRLIQMRPITGWGLRSFDLIAASLGHNLNGLPHEHNLYLAMAVGAGLPALFGFIGLIGSILGSALQAMSNVKPSLMRSQSRSLIFVTVIAIGLYLLSGLLDAVLYEPRVNLLSWLLLAALYGISRNTCLDQAALAQDRSLPDARDDTSQSA